MAKEREIKTNLLQSIILFVRENHAADIDKAYAYFWDEAQPDELLSGTALELGFVNFEDWLLFDYKVNEDKQTFLEIYAAGHAGLKAGEKAVIDKIKGSVLSFYEVVSVAKDKRVLLKDLLLDEEFSLKDKYLTRGLNKGDLFATRILELDGNHIMSGCVYPYGATRKKNVLAAVDKQFSRFKRNVNAEGTMREYLKDYGDVFNLIWLKLLTESPEEKQ